MGSAVMQQHARLANAFPPQLKSHDRFGRRIDQVEFHPSYHVLMSAALRHGLHGTPWSAGAGAHIERAAAFLLFTECEPSVLCPVSMSYAVTPALRANMAIHSDWFPGLASRSYDERFLPFDRKNGLTMGMGMTEKQGGSDVRANTTRAVPTGEDGWYSLTGHKWFCSAPMCDAFLTLAYAEGGMTCFLVPRWLPDGERNAGFRVMRLKDKLGDKSNASSEIEYHGALARRVGPEGRGVATIIQMVQLTRLDCVMGSASQMRASLAQALWHTAHRSAFQKRLVDQPAMSAVLADLALEVEAATALGFRLAQAIDADDPLARLLTPIAKYWVCKRAPGMVYEAMEAHGGAGYVEAGPMPRLFRQSPLNAIWEGSGNVIALDVLRALGREPDALVAVQAFLIAQRGKNQAYDRFLAGFDLTAVHEGTARLMVEHAALAAQAAVLLAWDNPNADAFCTLRLGERGMAYGAFDAVIDCRAIIERAMPQG